MKVTYTGTSDFREFSKADFDKAGVEGGKKLSFARGETVEVDDALGEALVSKEGLFGDESFSEAEDEEDEADTTKSAKAAAKASDAEGAPTSGKAAKTQSGGGDSAGSTGSTGKGSSTPSSTR